MYCKKCGQFILREAKYCYNCGNPVIVAENNITCEEDKSKPINEEFEIEVKPLIQKPTEKELMYHGYKKSYKNAENFDLFNIRIEGNYAFLKPLSNGINQTTISIQKDKIKIQNSTSDILFEANLDTFFLFELVDSSDQEIIIQKKKYYICRLNMLPDRYTTYGTIEIYCQRLIDKKRLVKAINCYNSRKTQYLAGECQRALETHDKYICDPLLLRYADNCLSENNSYNISYYKLLSLDRILWSKRAYRRFIYGCLVCDELDIKTKHCNRISIINTVFGLDIQQSDVSSVSHIGNSRIMGLVHLFVERTGENELTCRILAYFIIKHCLLRSMARQCSLYNIFESMDGNVTFSPLEAIEYYFQQKPYLVRTSEINRADYDSLLACLLLYRTYNCSADVAIESFWNDLLRCRNQNAVSDLISQKRLDRNRFEDIVKMKEKIDGELANDFMFSSVDSSEKENINRMCSELYCDTFFQTLNRFVEMIPKSIKEDIVLFSEFIVEYMLHERMDNENTDTICSAICRCNNMLPQRNRRVITQDFYRILDMYKVLIHKQYPEFLGNEALIIMLGIIKMLEKKAGEKAVAFVTKNSSESIEQRVSQLVRKGLMHPDNKCIITIFILSLYEMNLLESCMGIPLYNQYESILGMIKREYDNLAQYEFERLLMDETPEVKKHYSIDYVDTLNGVEFEALIAELFQAMGYTVKTTQASNDQGIDVIAERMSLQGNEKVGIQAKCYSGSVGNSAIQEVVAGMAYYKLNKAIVVTNSYFTNSAIKLAAANNVLLWDRNTLSSKLNILY